MRARLPEGVDPELVRERLAAAVSVSTRGPPHVALEEFDGEDIVVRIRATPVDDREGGRLAKEVLSGVAALRAESGRAAETA